MEKDEDEELFLGWTADEWVEFGDLLDENLCRRGACGGKRGGQRQVGTEDADNHSRNRSGKMRRKAASKMKRKASASVAIARKKAAGKVFKKPAKKLVKKVLKRPAAAAKAAAAAPTAVAPAATAAAGGAPSDTTPASAPTTVAAPAGGGPNEGAIAQLCEMGFPREEVEKCMQAAFNNPDRAVEYLTNGIPANMAAPPRSRSRSPQGHGGHGHGHGHDAGHGGDDAGHNCGEDHGAGHECSGHSNADGHETEGRGHGHVAVGSGRDGSAFPTVPAGGGGGGDGASSVVEDALQAIRNNPHFEQLRGAVLENPDVLPGLLQGLAATQPELAQAITANQEEFLLMLQSDEGDDDGGEDEAESDEGGDDGGEDEAHGDGHAHGGDAGQTVHVTEADRSAMERLAALGGFAPERALEAYLACDRNEELAANLLFDSTMD